MNKRMLCLWLPGWPLQRVVVERSIPRGQPLVLYAQQARRGQRVVCCSSAAYDMGIRTGMSLAEASALHSQRTDACAQGSKSPASAWVSLRIEEQDLGADMRSMEQLAATSQRYSPVVGLEAAAQPACLWMDVSGSALRLGGEVKLMQTIATDFHQLGYMVRIAIAETIGGAWAVSHYGELEPLYVHEQCLGHMCRVPPGLIAEVLAELPVEALRLDPRTLSTLHALGIMQIGQLLKLPREGLAARFDPLLLLRVDQAMGLTPEPIEVFQAPASLEAIHHFEHPTWHLSAVEKVVWELLEQLAARLDQRRQGALQLECQFSMMDIAAAEVIHVGLYQPTHVTQQLFELVQMQLQYRRFPGLIRTIAIRVIAAAGMLQQQPGLLPGSYQAVPAQLRHLIERMSSRLGVGSIVLSSLSSEPLPEHAFRYLPLTASTASSKLRIKRGSRQVAESTGQDGVAGLRPLRLFDPAQRLDVISGTDREVPDAFRYEGSRHRIAQWWGPERIETGWWRGSIARRDYFRVEDDSGGRFWIFRELHHKKWFLQGIFA